MAEVEPVEIADGHGRGAWEGRELHEPVGDDHGLTF
jgi:hypothetical protein